MRVPAAADTGELERIVNQACKDARKQQGSFLAAVNWEDLGFVELTRPRVLVEKASHNAHQLQQFIQARLWDAGFDVGVETAW